MQRQHAGKQAGTSGKSVQHAAAEAAVAVEQQHQIGHEFGTPAQAPVGGLVSTEIARGQRAGERHRLLKQEAQTFPGDGIDRS